VRNLGFNPKTFEYVGNNIPDLNVEEVNGRRYYVTQDGRKYPSVTTILGETAEKDYLEDWTKRVGKEESDRVTGRSARRGSAMHNICERYVLNETVSPSDEMPINLYMFKQIKKVLDKSVDKVYCVESALVSHKLKVAGRVDLIAEYDGVLSIIDYKTSARNKMDSWIEDYFVQTAMYSYMFWEMTGILTKKIVVVIAVEEETEAQVFVRNPADYILKAQSRAKLFHQGNEL
jgi:genome maintenance exonuclease 1